MSKSHTVLATVLLTSLVAFTLGPWVEAAEPPDSSGAAKAGGDGAFFHIPIRVQPLGGKVTVVANGAQWNALIDFAKVVESPAEKTGASSAREGAVPSLKPGARLPLVDELPGDNVLQFDDKSVSGAVLDEYGADSAAVFFLKGWSFSLGGPADLYLTGKEVHLVKLGDEENRYGFRPTSKVTVELHGVDMPGVLRLSKQPYPAINNPIQLSQARAPSEGTLEYVLSGGIAVANDPTTRLCVLFIENSGRASRRSVVRSVEAIRPRAKEGVSGFRGTTIAPSAGDGFKARPLTALALVTTAGGKHFVAVEEVRIVHRWAAVLAGLLGLVVIFVVAGVLYGIKKQSQDSEPWRFGRPMWFAKTPRGTYSVSLAQALLWTAILIWAGIYVWYSRHEFLAITTQMLVLVGIAGSTALTSKAAAMVRIGEIPKEYQSFIRVQDKPRWGDMITIRGQPNLFKFQIFAFTLVVGVQVIHAIFKTGAFPVLDDNVLTLMGISGGAYVANELATPNKWKDIREKLAKLKQLKEECEIAARAVPVSRAKAEQHRAAIQKAKDPSEASLKARLEGDISAKEQDETDAATKHETLQADLDKLDAEIKEALRAI